MIGHELEERNRIIGQNLRKYRLLKGMTQDELADQLCSVSQLSKVENGKTHLKRTILKQMAERLGVTVEKLESSDPVQEELRERLRIVQDAISISQYEHAYKLVKEIKEQSENFGYFETWTESILFECILLNRQKRYSETVQIIEQVLQEHEITDYNKTKLLLQLGVAYEQGGNMSAAIDCYRRAEQEFEAIYDEQDDRTSMSIFFNLTKCNIALKNYHGALRYAEKALDIANQSQRHLYRLRVRYMMATALAKLGRSKEAEDLYTSALAEAENNSFISDVAVISNNLGEFLFETGQYARAKMHFRRSKATFELLGDNFYICETFLFLSDLELLEGNVDGAIEYLNNVFTIVEKHGVSSFKDRAKALIRLGKIRQMQGEFEEFVRLVTEGLLIFEQSDLLDEAFAVAVELADTLYGISDPRAIDYYRKAVQSQKKRLG